MGEQVGARIHCKKQLRLLSIYKVKALDPGITSDQEYQGIDVSDG